jgi:hypothetical protein
MTGNEPDYVRSYRALHADFPHESTAKQLFDEHQFEAYRRLGYHAADDLFRQELLREDNPAKLEFREWWQRLANSLL